MKLIENKFFSSKKALILPFALFTASIFLMLISLTERKWAVLDEGTSVYEMSLFRCKNCPDYYGHWSWSCFSDYTCNSDHGIGSCRVYSNGLKAANFYFACELVAIIFGLMVIEKLILAFFNKDYGSKTFLFSLATGMLLTHTFGIKSWLIINGAQWTKLHRRCTFDAPCVYAENGPAISIINIFLCALGGLSLIPIMWKHNSPSSTDCILFNTYIRKYKVESWLKIIGSLFVSAFVIVAVAISYLEWVRREYKDSSWKGSLGYCHTCDKNIQNLDWECLASRECYSSLSSGSCELYTNMFNAYRWYLAFEFLTAICAVFFLQNYTYLVFQKTYGSIVMSYTYAIALSVFHFIATLIWFIQSDSEIFGSCHIKVNATDEIAMCFSFGPYALIISNFITIYMTVIFCYVFNKRSSGEFKVIGELKEDSNKNDNSPKTAEEVIESKV